MMLPNIAAWTLIVVLNGGGVTHNEGFKSWLTCLDARQLVLTGRTVEAEAVYQEATAKAEAAKAAARAEYAKKHPDKNNVAINTWVSIGDYNPIKVAECVPEVNDDLLPVPANSK